MCTTWQHQAEAIQGRAGCVCVCWGGGLGEPCQQHTITLVWSFPPVVRSSPRLQVPSAEHTPPHVRPMRVTCRVHMSRITTSHDSVDTAILSTLALAPRTPLFVPLLLLAGLAGPQRQCAAPGGGGHSGGDLARQQPGVGK